MKRFGKTISKSLFIRGNQCQKSLWLYAHRRDVVTPPGIGKQALFEQGHAVGLLARTLFPGGKEIPFSTPFSEKFQLTNVLMAAKTPAIYEASFQHDGLMCMVDILKYTNEGWELIEVKSSTSEKENVLIDIALQFYILTALSIPISRVTLLHINSQYERLNKLDPSQFFTQVDVTESINALQTEIDAKIRTSKNVFSQTSEPELDIGPHCFQPYDCDCMTYCWRKIPTPSIFNISGLKMDRKFELYYQGILQSNQLPENYPLSETEYIQVQSDMRKERHIDREKILAFLETFHYPICYLDFETFQRAIPPFKHTSPYQQIPFQYSLHCLNSPFDVSSHFEHLGEPELDPRPELVRKLCKQISDGACIVAYNSQFEKKVLLELARIFPKYATKLKMIADALVDLMIPFQKRWFYDPAMTGSYSIKKVLPCLVPDLSYDDLKISNGEIASLSYANLRKDTPEEIYKETKTNLLGYCERDTWAMVQLHQALRQECQPD